MDSTALVNNGHALLRVLDGEGLAPRFAMWVHISDTDTWKLWLVPPKGLTDKREFYRRLSVALSKERTAVGNLDASDTEMMLDSNPAIVGIGSSMKAPGFASIQFIGNRYNNYYVPNGIILRSDLH